MGGGSRVKCWGSQWLSPGGVGKREGMERERWGGREGRERERWEGKGGGGDGGKGGEREDEMGREGRGR